MGEAERKVVFPAAYLHLSAMKRVFSRLGVFWVRHPDGRLEKIRWPDFADGAGI